MDYVTNWPSKSKIRKCFESREADLGKNDRISKLPDEILLQILSYLPGKQVAATSILSTRWRPLCSFFSILNFHLIQRERIIWGIRFGVVVGTRIISLDSIQRKLRLNIPETARIAKFRLQFCVTPLSDTPYDEETKLKSSLSDVVRHKVEELDLSFPRDCNLRWLSLPHSLFTCDSLTSLKLTTINIRLDQLPTTSICLFPSLKTLHLCETRFDNEKSAEQLLSACLDLEELVLYECYWRNIKSLTISIPTLLRLSVIIDFFPLTCLRICCPNIQSFKWVSDWPIKLVILSNLPSMANADFDVRVEGCINKYNVVDLHPVTLLGCQIYLTIRTLRLFNKFCGVKSLTVSHPALELICFAEKFVVDDDDHLPTLYSLTHLKVSDSSDSKISCFSLSSAALINILQKSPNLQSLEFPDGLELIKDEKNLILNDDCVPPCLNTSLKTLTVSKFKGGAKEVQFLEYILKNVNGQDFIFCCNGVII